MGSILHLKRGNTIRLIIASLLLMLILSLSGCFTDFYAGQRPPSYPNSTWVCEEADIFIRVYREGLCVLVFGDAKEEMDVNFSNGRDIIISQGTGHDLNVLFIGKCKFSPEKLTVTPTEDNLFGGQYNQLDFIKVKSN